MQVCTLMASHVVWFTRIYEEIRLCVGSDAGFKKAKCMLWNNYWIV